jgi:hypothetical protein
MQTLRRAMIAKASTTLNINQQVGASIGTAVLSVLLANQLSDRMAPDAGGAIGVPLPPAVLEKSAPLMADAYAHTFWYAVGLVVVALVVALVLLPKSKPEPIDDPDDPRAAEEAPVAAMMH